MAHLPMDDAEMLFNDDKERTWSGLYKVLQQRKGKAEGISDNLITMMMPIVQRIEQMHRPFPSSPNELDNELNAELAKVEPATARR